eukprot:CAMPEP_0201575428 /NCGR_PEP_ID=MMETSP0190_2-20130828/20637_1 /ASSEMBLY_ACC=CAM_ASM_000263 /TAXON_ID=37353 /ORGANISM="Rosalina sp." /LENGTH=40 /DNA_ID= /DNA_START= /DNA_END= /DNA_ORIENTATION=
MTAKTITIEQLIINPSKAPMAIPNRIHKVKAPKWSMINIQ